MLNQINDIREKFNNISFSGFQKSKVKSELLKCLESCKIENSCYWSAELICAGHYIDLWELIISYSCKNINLGNPKLPIYLEMRYSGFKDLINSYNQRELELRNNSNIRLLFSEIICVLIYSKKKIKINEIKIPIDEVTNFINISQKLKAKDHALIQKIFYDDDPKEIYIPINEFLYCINTKNLQETIYWLEWIILFENNCNKNGKYLNSKNRMFAPKGFERDIIMIIWEIIFYFSNEKNEITSKICKSLFNIFCIKYNKNIKKKRRIIIYFALQLIIENYDLSIDIIKEKEKINNIKSNIDNIYKDIKKNEESPGTEYLFKNIKGKSIEKSMNKLNILNNFEKNENISSDSDIDSSDYNDI